MGELGRNDRIIFFELKNRSLEEEGGEVQLAVFWRSSQVVVLTAPALAPGSAPTSAPVSVAMPGSEMKKKRVCTLSKHQWRYLRSKVKMSKLPRPE